MRRARARPDAGFLLAETLITFALSALVLAGLATSAAVLLRATDRSVAAVGSADDLGRTLAALERDVSELRRVRWNGDEPQNFVFRGGPNSLFFAQDVADGDGGRALQVLSLREIVAGRGTALVRATAHLSPRAAGWSDLHFGAPSDVATGPARLRFHYLAEPDADGRAARPTDTWASGPTLPAAIVVEAVDAATARPLVAERIAIRADGDIGCSDRAKRKDKDKATAGNPLGLPPALAGVPAPAPGLNININEDDRTANKNEFCGRADRGVPPKPAPVAGVPVAGVAR